MKAESYIAYFHRYGQRDWVLKRRGRPAQLAALIAQWRRSADVVEGELQTIRRNHPEGPRYGIAAVRQCADELEALVHGVQPSPDAPIQLRGIIYLSAQHD